MIRRPISITRILERALFGPCREVPLFQRIGCAAHRPCSC